MEIMERYGVSIIYNLLNELKLYQIMEIMEISGFSVYPLRGYKFKFSIYIYINIYI